MDNREELIRKAFWFLLATCVVVVVGPSVAQAAGVGGIPQISNFMSTVRTTIVQPIGFCLFSAGAVKVGGNVVRSGWQGLAEGGAGMAGSGAIIGGVDWIGSQLGVTGALIQ